MVNDDETTIGKNFLPFFLIFLQYEKEKERYARESNIQLSTSSINNRLFLQQ